MQMPRGEPNATRPAGGRFIPLAASFLTLAGSAAAAGWKFEWSDEFEGPNVDATVWGYENGHVRNQELQYYTNRQENSRIEDGRLLIQARRDNWNGHEYTSASRRTSGRKSFRYGRFEMRARIDIRPGSWPAWWWLPNSGGWPKGGEIDMMEFYQGKCLFNVMDGNQRWTSPTRTIASLGGARWAEEYHTWTMIWDSTRIQLALDGVLINDYPVSQADGTGPNGVNPFRQPGYFILNQAIGGTQGGDPSNTSFPVEFRVDWVRAHTWSEGPARTVTVAGGTGTGAYVEGTRASITAHWPPAGQVFDRWVADAGNPIIDDPANPSAFLTVGPENVELRATYRARGASFIRPHAPGRTIATGTESLLGFRDIRGRRVLVLDAQVPLFRGR
jgi:beta-glucanase (GH16 family)